MLYDLIFKRNKALSIIFATKGRGGGINIEGRYLTYYNPNTDPFNQGRSRGC